MTIDQSTAVYESAVTQVGSQVEEFLGHGLLIFFGAGSPRSCTTSPSCTPRPWPRTAPRPGDTVHLGDVSMEVLAVGHVVRDNLINLGHLDLKADGRTEAKLPGDVCVRTGDIPLLTVGDTFRITRPTHLTKEQSP